MKKRVVLVLAAVVAVACAPATTKGPTRDTNVITEAELSKINVINAFEAINRLRPTYLRSRGRTRPEAGTSAFASVYVDGQPYGDISTLRNIQIGQVREIHYYGNADAMTKFGAQRGTGVIEIIMR